MEILYSDKNIVVCVKPVGVDSEKDLPKILADELGGEFFTLHRLDLNVGGVMVYARTKSAAALMSRLIQEGQMIKEYVAEVHGIPPENDVFEDLLWKDSKKNKVFVVNRERKGVKKAKLEYRRVSCGETSQVQIRLHTGRSHQIRVQFASRGFPLVGDHKYGSRDEEKSPKLFSSKLSFPYNGSVVEFSAFPEWFSEERE